MSRNAVPFSSQSDLSPLLVTSTVSISVRGAIVKDIRKREKDGGRIALQEFAQIKLKQESYILIYIFRLVFRK